MTGALSAPGGGGLNQGDPACPIHVQILCILTLTFYGSNDIDHLMCDFFSLLKLACSAPYRLATVVAANRGAMCKLIFSMLLNSYSHPELPEVPWL